MEDGYSKVKVFSKHLQPPGVIHQACIGSWTNPQSSNDEHTDHIDPLSLVDMDLVFGKGTYLSLCRFKAGTSNQDSGPTGTLEVVHEQPVFGTIKDMKTFYCTFDTEGSIGSNSESMDVDRNNELPDLGYLPPSSSPTILVATSDSGVLSFLTFYGNQTTSGYRGHFYILKEIEISPPGLDFSFCGTRLAIDPTNRLIAVAALQDSIKLVILRNTTRTHFDPIERISTVDLKGTIVGMEFLSPDTNEADETAILAVLFYNMERSKYHIATFHIDLRSCIMGPLSIQCGASQIDIGPSNSVLHLKALPNIPRAMIYVDEENISLVTVQKPLDSKPLTPAIHSHHGSLQLLRRERHEFLAGNTTAQSPAGQYPLISACATPPRSPDAAMDQTVYLGSDTAELYRINIHGLTLTMAFELISGDKPVGDVMIVLARQQLVTEFFHDRDPGREVTLHTDYLLYSSDQGDGNILAIGEGEDGIDLFAVTELPNCSPIMDFCAREPSFPGRDALYVCSGMKTEGSVKRIRYGVSTVSSGSSGQEYFAGATGIWSAKENRTDEHDTFLIVSFVQSTKVMRRGDGGSLEDISDSSGLDLSQAAVCAGRLSDGFLFQVHRAGVVATSILLGKKYVWTAQAGVIASACWATENLLLVGQVSSGTSSVIFLRFTGADLDQTPSHTSNQGFQEVTSRTIGAEPTTIFCWEDSPIHQGTAERDSDTATSHERVFCCVGTLEPSILLFEISSGGVLDVYAESLAQTGSDNVTIPHSISVLKNGSRRIVLVGLRDGCIISYSCLLPMSEHYRAQPSLSARVLYSPRLFKLGILPVKFAFTDDKVLSKALVMSDKLWQIAFKKDLEIQSVLFDDEVSQACSFQSTNHIQSSPSEFSFIVDNLDMQLVNLESAQSYSRQTLSLGETPRRILDISSKRLLLVACVGAKFPFAESTVYLIDPERSSSELGQERQHIVAQFGLKQGESVYSMTEWRIPRPNKSDAVYLCIGTGIFSATGSEMSASAPRTGRLVVLSVKQSKKQDRRHRRFELDLRWAMTMSAPVFAISIFKEMMLLISNGPLLKLLALDLEKKTLVERANYRERWPIVQISTHGNMICTGSRRESICFYEYQPGVAGERSFDKLKFLKSARSARVVSDCLAISSDFAVGVDMAGGIFGVGYSKDGPTHQRSLADIFSFHIGEAINRIRITDIWHTEERSLRGVPLIQRSSKVATIPSESNRGLDDGRLLTQPDCYGQLAGNALSTSSSTRHLPVLPLELASLMTSWILLPWTPPGSETSTNPPNSKHKGPSYSGQGHDYKSETGQDSILATTHQEEMFPQPTSTSYPSSSPQRLHSKLSSQALIGCSLLGSVIGFWRLNPAVFTILSSVQTILQTLYSSRPVLGNLHDRYRSFSSQGQGVIDGDLMDRYLDLTHESRVEVVGQVIGLAWTVEEWMKQCEMTSQEKEILSNTTSFSSAQPVDGRRNLDEHFNTIIHDVCLAPHEKGLCKTSNVINHILLFLCSLDWHQK